MDTIRKIFKIGYGPSSSHAMGPAFACETVKENYPDAGKIEVILYGALAATGKGHLTDRAIMRILREIPTTIIWKPEEKLPEHPNGMEFLIYKENELIAKERFYSIGGGEISRKGFPEVNKVYPHRSMKEILEFCEKNKLTLWKYVFIHEENDLKNYLKKVWNTMQKVIKRGISKEGVLPGGLGVRRKAREYHQKAKLAGGILKEKILLSSFALAVAEENASGEVVVTAPTCGSSGVLPAIIYYFKKKKAAKDEDIIKALATAGLIGNLVKYNASISGAEVGCQGEIGTACAMASGAVTQLFGGNIYQIEYAAEMAIEHHLGLTCDPVMGMVQIPCIERNVFATNRALDCATYAIFSDGKHFISFDKVVTVMKKTGHDLPYLYKETARGGLAKEYEEKS